MTSLRRWQLCQDISFAGTMLLALAFALIVCAPAAPAAAVAAGCVYAAVAMAFSGIVALVASFVMGAR